MDTVTLIGILEHAKRDIGRSLGILRAKKFPSVDGQLARELEKAYEKVKWVQDEVWKI